MSEHQSVYREGIVQYPYYVRANMPESYKNQLRLARMHDGVGFGTEFDSSGEPTLYKYTLEFDGHICLHPMWSTRW